jgi:hypothetical protein
METCWFEAAATEQAYIAATTNPQAVVVFRTAAYSPARSLCLLTVEPSRAFDCDTVRGDQGKTRLLEAHWQLGWWIVSPKRQDCPFL